MNKNSYLQKGFTLIELLIVIAILGILAATVLIAINPGQRIAASKNARVRADLSSIGSAATLFNTDTGIANCTGGASYPNAFAISTPVCGATFNPSSTGPDASTYTIVVTPTSCVHNTASPCTGFAVSGPRYNDGTIPNVTSTANAFWCWKSSTGSISVTDTAALCVP